MENKDLKSVSEKLASLKSARILLRRSFGRKLSTADIQTKVAFMEATNETDYMKTMNPRNFFIVTLMASQMGMNGKTVKMPEYLNSVYNDNNVSDTRKRQIVKLFSLDPRYEEYFISEIAKQIRFAHTKGVKIDEELLYRDLSFWKERTSDVAENWARKTIKKAKEKSEKTLEEEKND